MSIAVAAASVVYAITLGLDAAVLVLALRTAGVPLAEGQPPLIDQLPFYVPIMLAYSTVGALVAAKRPRNPIGWLFLAVAILFSSSIAVAGYRIDTQLDGSPATRAFVDGLPVGDPFDLVLNALSFILLLYPTGRLPSRRWWPVAVLLALAATLGHVYSGPGQEVFGFAILPAFAAPFIRLRRASPIERRQIEWFVYVLVLTILSFVASIVVNLFDPSFGGWFWALGAFFAGMIAVASGVAILRHNLFDIEVLIRRTVIYGATTAGIALTFFAVVLVIQTVLSRFIQGNELAVAVSTLASLALFQPVRRRVQGAVDRRFYRSRYDAGRVLDAFSAQLRDEVDLAAVRSDLVRAVHRTVEPEHVSVWLRGQS